MWINLILDTHRTEYTCVLMRFQTLIMTLTYPAILQVDAAIALMELSIEMNTTYHRVSMNAVPGQLQTDLLNVSPEETIFFHPLDNFPTDELTDEER